MKLRTFLIAILLSTLVVAQPAKRSIYKSIQGLTIVDSVSLPHFISGFSFGNGIGGYSFEFDSNSVFHKIEFSCGGRTQIDSGFWEVKNGNTLTLISRKATVSFDVLKFGKHYFYILPSQRQRLVNEIEAAKFRLRNVPFITVGNDTYTVDEAIAISLENEYYSREIDDLTGT